MHARGLQHSDEGLKTPKNHFDSCMCEDCNPINHIISQRLLILIHACARIATVRTVLEYYGRKTFWFMHVRGLQQQICTDFCAYFCSFIRFFCFNSCMREDCNIKWVRRQKNLILIHACARIATVDGLYHQASDRYILIHACARIATVLCRGSTMLHFNSCMCKDCNW